MDNQTPPRHKSAPPPPGGLRHSRLIALLLAVTCVCALTVSIDSSVLAFLSVRIAVIAAAVLPGIAIVMTCAGWGDLLVRPAASVLHFSERLVLAFACGLGVVGAGSGVLGFAGMLNQATSLVFIGAGLLVGLPLWRQMIHGVRGDYTRRDPTSWPQTALLFMLCIVVLLLAIFALTPPLIFDVTEYHLGAWTSYSAQGGTARFVPMPYNFYARFPFPVEAVYYLGLSASPGLDAAPKVINALCVLACGVLGANFVRRCGTARAGQMLAAIAVITLPVMLDVSVDAMIDAPVALMVVASVFACFLRGHKFPAQTETTPALILPALFTFGAALTSKYTVAQLYLLPWCAVALPCLFRRPAPATARYMAIAIAAAAVPCMLWFGKNYVLYQNPLEPFFVKWFRPQDALGIAREKFYVESHFPQSPLSAAYWTSLFPRLHEFVWLYLVACAGWIFVTRRGIVIRVLLFAAASWLLWNLVRESQNRFLLPAMIMITCAAVVGSLSLPGAMLRRVAAASVVLFSMTHVVLYGMKLRESGAVGYMLDFYPDADGELAASEPKTAREVFVEKNLGDLGEVLTAIRQQLPPESPWHGHPAREKKLLLIYEARPYLFRNDATYNVVWDPSVLLDIIRPAQSAAQAWAHLQEAGFTHVVVNRQELLRYIQQYARKSQLIRLGLRPGGDPRLAWSATSHPEDLYPPFYRDPDWDRLRPVVHELLDRINKGAVIRRGLPAGNVQIKPLDIIVTPLI